MPISRFDEIAVIEALRNGSMTTIDVAMLKGIINFPSFHASAAILFIWGAWPFRPLRWPFVAVNILMLAATPIEGTHYLADVLGGVVVAFAAIGTSHLRKRVIGGNLRPLSFGDWQLGKLAPSQRQA